MDTHKTTGASPAASTEDAHQRLADFMIDELDRDDLPPSLRLIYLKGLARAGRSPALRSVPQVSR